MVAGLMVQNSLDAALQGFFWEMATNSTPLKINMEPKNGDFEDDFPFQRGDFQVPCYFSGGDPSKN